ncbi:xanthine dehydrogenase family protein molybdopterin-binding subunit, partial [Candidatus Bathyarchaeota archaeon]|nr:xanthine dehydrogenase family protein molybdopterin-binding subunit [Candidatus Bathyarchaeota archaeon]
MSSQGHFAVLGKDTVRKDGFGKVTGLERFASDLSLPKMLHVRVLKSTQPHARVKNIDAYEALSLGAQVLVPDDVPDVRFCPRLVSTPEATYKDWRVLTRKPLYVGEAIAAIAAETEEQAQVALESIKVEYEPLPAYFDVFEAHKPDSVQLHDDVLLKDQPLKVEGN